MTDAHLVHEEPGGEEESDAEEDDGEVREHGGVDGGHVAGHRAVVQVHDAAAVWNQDKYFMCNFNAITRVHTLAFLLISQCKFIEIYLVSVGAS